MNMNINDFGETDIIEKPVKIIIVNGPPQAGKNTFCDYCRLLLSAEGWDSRIMSSVDFIKEMAKQIGWDGTKTQVNRAFLSDLKTLLVNWDDVPFKQNQSEIKKIAKANDKREGVKGTIFFIMVREPDEIDKYVKRLNAMTLLVHKETNETFNNPADMHVYDYDYDYFVDNNGSIDELKDGARQMCNFFIRLKRKSNDKLYENGVNNEGLY